MANTFIQLNDVPSDYIGRAGDFVRVKGDQTGLAFTTAQIDSLSDVRASGAYTPAPGQTLGYTAAGKWQPVDIDPYSAGNGLSKVSDTLNVVATGGLVANASGVYIADIANVAGTYGAANTVPTFTVNSKGQITDVEQVSLVADQAQTITDNFVANIQGMPGTIRVTGGEGNASNPTIELVATGVTAATYGNATHAPQITVDSYGRIQNVDLVEMVGGLSEGGDGTGVSAEDAYNMHKYFKTFRVGGVRNENNEVYGVDIAAEVPQDTFYIESLHGGLVLNPNGNTDSLNFDIDAGAIAADMNIGNLADVDTADIADGDVLIWNSANSQFEAGTVGGDDSIIDLTDFDVTTASASGNGALSYNNNGTFTFTPADLSQYATESFVTNAINNLDASGDQSLSISDTTLTISGGNSVSLNNLPYARQSDVESANSAMRTYVDTLALSGGDSRGSNVDLTGYATTAYVDSRELSLTGNVISLAGSSVDLTDILVSGTDGQNGVNGTNGVDGADGQDGVSVSSATVIGNNLLITLSDGTPLDAGNVRGPQGPQGIQGAQGAQGLQGERGADGVTQDLTGYATTSYVDSEIANVSVDLTGYATESYVTSAINALSDSDSQTLSLSGSTLTISNGNSVDLSGLGGGGGATALGDLTDVSSTTPSTGQVLKWNGSSWAPATDNTSAGGGNSGGTGATVQRFKVNYTSSGAIDSITDATDGISSVTVDSASGGEVTVNFDNSSFNLPPGACTMYGYDHSNNIYVMTPFESTMGLRQIPAGGTSGAPTLFDGSDTLQIQMRIRETETGASRGGFGTTTHAWVQFVMYN